MGRPKISVITPSLNQGRFIERTICSVLDQGYENLEYVVVDGGSTDNTIDILRLYDQDLAWWTCSPDSGPAEAINQALKKVTGDIVAILASDDIYLPGTLDTVARTIGDGDVPWMVGHVSVINEDDLELGSNETASPKSLGGFLKHDSGYLPLAASFFDRRVFDRFGAFDESMEFAFDYEHSCRLLAFDTSAQVLGRVLAARREHPGSKSAMYTVQQGLEFISAARRYANHLPIADRYALWRNCDQREKIYALAQAEMKSDASRRFIWSKVLKHPWWLTDMKMRHILVHGVDHPLPIGMAA